MNWAVLCTFFQNFVVNLVGRFTVVCDSSRHCDIQTLRSRSEVVWWQCWFRCRHASIFRNFIFIYRVVTIARPKMDSLANVLHHFMDQRVIVVFRGEFLFRVIGWSSCGPTSSTIDAVIWNAWVESPDETWIVKSTFRYVTIWVVWAEVSEQLVPLSLVGNGNFIAIIVRISTRMREVLMISFVLVNIVEIVREKSIIGWRRSSIEWATSDTLK